LLQSFKLISLVFKPADFVLINFKIIIIIMTIKLIRNSDNNKAV